jgi:hypothetical protein
MNMFKLQNGDILNLDYIVSIKHINNPDEYIVYLRTNVVSYISKQDYDELCTRLFSLNK